MAFQSNVISSQPQVSVTQYTVSSGLSDWSSNVCDCCEDCGICKCFTCVCEIKPTLVKCQWQYVRTSPGLCATFVPCILGCKVAQDNGDSCCLPFLPGAMIALRTSMRHKYHIDVSVLKLSKHIHRNYYHYLHYATYILYFLTSILCTYFSRLSVSEQL